MRKSMWLGASILTAVFCLLAARPLMAGNDTKRTMEFLGFTEDGKKYLLRISDANTGDFFSVRSFETGKQIQGVPIENPKEEKKLLEETRKKHKITDKGVEGLTSPDERYSIIAIPKGDQFQLNLMRGERTAKFQTIELAKSEKGTVAKGMLKGVHWSKDCKRIVVILHQRLLDDNGIDADEARPFEMLVGSLNWK